jgi:hypothetical protein
VRRRASRLLQMRRHFYHHTASIFFPRLIIRLGGSALVIRPGVSITAKTLKEEAHGVAQSTSFFFLHPFLLHPRPLAVCNSSDQEEGIWPLLGRLVPAVNMGVDAN